MRSQGHRALPAPEPHPLTDEEMNSQRFTLKRGHGRTAMPGVGPAPSRRRLRLGLSGRSWALETPQTRPVWQGPQGSRHTYFTSNKPPCLPSWASPGACAGGWEKSAGGRGAGGQGRLSFNLRCSGTRARILTSTWARSPSAAYRAVPAMVARVPHAGTSAISPAPSANFTLPAAMQGRKEKGSLHPFYRRTH